MNKRLLDKSNKCFDLLQQYESEVNEFKAKLPANKTHIEALGDDILPLLYSYSNNKSFLDARDILKFHVNVHIIFKLHNNELNRLEYEHIKHYRRVEKVYEKVFGKSLRAGFAKYKRDMKKQQQ